MAKWLKACAVRACGVLCAVLAVGACVADGLPPPKMDWQFGSDAQSLNQSNFGNAGDIETVREGDGFALRVSNRRSSKYPWKTMAVKGVVPAEARFAVLRLSCDQPNMMVGQLVSVSSVEYFERKDGFGWDFGDLEPPEMARISPSPCADLSAPVSVWLSDPSGVDRSTFRCTLDGMDVTAMVSWEGDVFTYRPQAKWDVDSLHEFAVTCADTKGNEGAMSCFACFTAVPFEHESVAVRDDGMMLVWGHPFFPVSISSVCACSLNGGDVERGVRELKGAGFNMLSTYMVGNAEKPQADEFPMIPRDLKFAFGQPPISALLKETGLLVAANSATGEVAARFTMPDGKVFAHVFERNGVLVK